MGLRLTIDQGTSATVYVNLFDENGNLITTDALAGASAEFLVRADPAVDVNLIRLLTTDVPPQLMIDAVASVLTLSLSASDTAIALGSYFYRVRVTYADNEVDDIDAWSPFDIVLGGAASIPPPPFDSTVKIDHNYQLPDDLTFLTPGGSPIVNAQVRLYNKADYVAGNLSAPIGTTTTDAGGHWVNPILVPPGYSYIVRFEKPYEWSPVTVEIFA